MLPQHDKPAPRFSSAIFFGAAFSLCIGGLALLLAVGGFLGKGGRADIATALPNLITGLASISGAIGYLARRKWAIPVYTLAVIGHFVSHALLLVSHGDWRHISAGRMISVWLIPVLALLVLMSMEQQRRRGVLS